MVKNGIVIRKTNGYYTVDNNGAQIECKIKGIIKRDNLRDSCIAGDFVEFCDTDRVITKVLPRRNLLVRPNVANIDRFIITFASKEPAPDFEKLSLLVINSFFYKIEPVIVINKIDLLPPQETALLKELLAQYENIGIKVILVSAAQNINIELLRSVLSGKVSALGGPSGVGKSSILNAIQDNIKVQIGELSSKIKRGKHTTRDTTLVRMDCGGFLIDSPGFSFLDLPPIENIDTLLSFFPEFSELHTKCRFRDCIHINEPDCAVKNAVSENTIPVSRYDFYKNTLNALKERWNKYDK